ncbi:MAG: alcohol dehydrogenase [Cenarchaeum symbiont of Oopsacas minuta]|nr:alcohol dehydrogenase [Cenarchaeum symbiont of Oopsacas minuta]
MKAARIIESGEPLEITEVDDQKPTGTEVVIRVKSVGICHSDLHLWEGGYDLGDGEFMKVTDRGVKYPITPGHEISGIIKDTGMDVNGVSKGDQVLVYPWIGCGNCPGCSSGNENLCDAPKSIGVFCDGGYAQTVKIPHPKYLANIDGVNLDEATSLACSGLTAYTAVKKANVNTPCCIVIIGAGGLGLMGVQVAKAVTDAKIICVDLDDKKLKVAKEKGADYIFNSKESRTAEKIIDVCGGLGAESVIDFVNAPPTAKMGLAILRKRGNLILVGLFGGSVDISLVTIPLKSLTIQGAYTGNFEDMKELIELAKKGAISPIISKKYSLNEANMALNDLKDRKILGRAVINP